MCSLSSPCFAQLLTLAEEALRECEEKKQECEALTEQKQRALEEADKAEGSFVQAQMDLDKAKGTINELLEMVEEQVRQKEGNGDAPTTACA